jgi:hypothetical protein
MAAVPVLLVAALVGFGYASYPFEGEQAFFTMGAELMSRGGELYRDFWDIKQPGIFYFYLVGGSLFGFNETGIFTLEWLYLLLFASVLVVALRRYFASPVIAACVPLFTVVFYYGVAGPWHRCQVEALVGFPLFLVLWFALRAEESPSLAPVSCFLSGLFGGIVLLLKCFFLPILLALWLPIVVCGTKKSQHSLPSVIFCSILCVLGGTLLPLLVTAVYFASRGTLGLLLWTTFVWPGQSVSQVDAVPVARLLRGYRFFLWNCAPSLALSVVALVRPASKRLDPLNRGLVLWLVSGLAVIHLQVQSWFEYHYLLLFVPLGILAARGLDAIWSRVPSRWGRPIRTRSAIYLATYVCILYVSPLSQLAYRMIHQLRRGFPPVAKSVNDLALREYDLYRRAGKEVEFLREPSSVPGPIYACANPVYVFLSGRREPIALSGSNFLHYTQGQGEQLMEQLRESPPSYIFVQPNRQPVVDGRFSFFKAFLGKNYRELRRSAAGVWYVTTGSTDRTDTDSRNL